MAQRLFGTVQEALDVMCFERTALPPQQQTSDFPASDEANVAYYHGALPGNQVWCAGRGCHTWLLMTSGRMIMDSLRSSIPGLWSCWGTGCRLSFWQPRAPAEMHLCDGGHACFPVVATVYLCPRSEAIQWYGYVLLAIFCFLLT